ncbi:RNA-directed DNA polymerase, eukaryota, reverse transcriptase zinc-binding domain protein [Tanacetum coccineum]
MANIRTCNKHNMIACVEKTEHNADFHQIVDYLTGCSINYSLLVDPDLIGPWLQQFWATASLRSINEVPHIRAMVAGKRVLISEETIRADLLFDDADGVDCFPKQVIWDSLRDMDMRGCMFSKGSSSTLLKVLLKQYFTKYAEHKVLLNLQDESQTSGGDEGLLDLYALNREVRRLKKQTISQAKQIHKLKAKLKKLSKGVSHMWFDITLLWVKKCPINHTAFVYEDVDATEAVVTPDLERKSDETEESTARQSTVTPRMKWVWRFYNQKTSLWANVIKAIHGEDGIMEFMRLKLGNGDTTSFWNDNWSGGGVLKDLYPRLYALENGKSVNVCTKLSDPSMDYSFRRKTRGGAEQVQLNALLELVSTVNLVPMGDRWVWTLENSGEFSVASLRKVIDEKRLPSVCSKTRWVKYVPIKVNVLAWKIKMDVLPTRLNISRRGIDIHSISCPICDCGVESSDHLFFRCNLTRQIARKISFWWNVKYEDVNSYDE